MTDKVFGEMLKEVSADYSEILKKRFANGKPTDPQVLRRLNVLIRMDFKNAVTKSIQKHGIPWKEQSKCRSRICSEIRKGDAVARWTQPQLPLSA